MTFSWLDWKLAARLLLKFPALTIIGGLSLAAAIAIGAVGIEVAGDLLYKRLPVHLGIIFVANLELGYLTPPVGMNLFLSSYRFDRPLLEVCRASVPMLLILGTGLLLITYVPWLTTVLLPLVAEAR